MNLYKNIAAFFILMCYSISCKKSFLDQVSNRQVIYRQDYVVDLKTTEEFMNGIYTMMSSAFYVGYHTIYPDLIADNIKPASISTLPLQYSWAQVAEENRDVSLNASAKNANGISYALYKIIVANNFVLEKAEEFKNENPQKAALLKGQAYTLRALSHFFLVNVFAQSYNFSPGGSHPGIAYVTSSDWTKPVTRQTVGEIYANMIADLDQAVQFLPSSTNSTLIVNSNTAKALLARIYLFKEDYAQSKNLAAGLSNTVSLLPVASGYPNNLFKLLPADQTEILFQVAPGPSISLGNVFSSSFAGRYLRGSIQFFATNDIAGILNEQATDARKNWVTSASGGRWNITKFPMDAVPDFTGVAGGNYYQAVIRSSEMYLTAAECYAKLNNEDSARYYLDAIRKRADPAAIASTATGPDLMDSIYKERRKEFAFEGFRMFDLLRWKRPVNRIDVLAPAPTTLSYPNNKAIAPIPALDQSVAGIPQNPGY